MFSVEKSQINGIVDLKSPVIQSVSVCMCFRRSILFYEYSLNVVICEQYMAHERSHCLLIIERGHYRVGHNIGL